MDTWVGAIEVPKPGAYTVKITAKATGKTAPPILHEFAPIPIAHQLDKVAKEPVAPPPVVEAPVAEPAPKAEPAAAEPAPAGGMPNWLFYSY